MKKKDRIKQKEFMAAYEPIHDRFERFCQVRASSVIDQKDLMNETLYRAYHSWNKIKNKKALLYFLFGTAKNIVLNAGRKKREMKVDDLEVIKINNQAELDLEIAFLYRQIDKLSEEKKEAIILFEISGFSIKEIAQMQNTSEGSVNMRLSRARKELKVLLMDEVRIIPIKEFE